MPEETGRTIPPAKPMTTEQLVARIGDLRAQRNVVVTMRNKVENLYRYAVAHPDILPEHIQYKIVGNSSATGPSIEFEYNYKTVARQLNDSIKSLQSMIAELTTQLKNMN